MNKGVLKSKTMRIIISTGIVLMLSFGIVSGQDAAVATNIEKAKTANGKTYSIDGKILVSVNVKFIETYYAWSSTADTMSCYIMPNKWDMASLATAAQNYRQYLAKSEINLVAFFPKEKLEKSNLAVLNKSININKY
jgi:hypothetical protein